MVKTAPETAMKAALKAAWDYQLLTYPNPAVGAVCFDEKGLILSTGAHKYTGGPHAEVYAIRDAYTLLSGDETIAIEESSHAIHDYLKKHHSGLFSNVSMAVTLEPCTHFGKTPSCASLISELGIQKVYVSVKDPNPDAAGGIEYLNTHEIQCEFGLLEDQGRALLEPFATWQHKPFVFFKWAQRLDGSIDEGTISSEGSRKHVHAIRNVCDLIIIGGNTVRTDRPTLDARMVGGKAPDVLIYSHQDSFDQSIPLFSVPGRKVMISDSLQSISQYSLVLVEGGMELYKALKEEIQWSLCYIAPFFGQGKTMMGGITEEFELLHGTIAENITLWMKKK